MAVVLSLRSDESGGAGGGGELGGVKHSSQVRRHSLRTVGARQEYFAFNPSQDSLEIKSSHGGLAGGGMGGGVGEGDGGGSKGSGGGGEGDGGGGDGEGGGGEGGEDGGGGESDAHGVCTYNSVWLTVNSL